MKQKEIDSTDESGTRALCVIIRKYWVDRGRNVVVKPILRKYGSGKKATSVWGIWSNIGPYE
jgi:hypothetical protein